MDATTDPSKAGTCDVTNPTDDQVHDADLIDLDQLLQVEMDATDDD